MDLRVSSRKMQFSTERSQVSSVLYEMRSITGNVDGNNSNHRTVIFDSSRRMVEKNRIQSYDAFRIDMYESWK